MNKRTLNSILFLIIIAICSSYSTNAQKENTFYTKRIAKNVLNKGIKNIDLGLYPGTLLMHAMSELTLADSGKILLTRTIELFEKYKTKEIEGRGSFISYRAGGSGAAYLMYKDVTNALDNQVSRAAKEMMKRQKRSSEGLLVPHWIEENLDQVFRYGFCGNSLLFIFWIGIR